jgi:hypothetical protein
MQAGASVQSVSGDVFVRDYSGHLSIRSVIGNLHFVFPKTTRLCGNTASGRILYYLNSAYCDPSERLPAQY